MQTSLSVPSKTFLLGEYLALHGGPSLVITHFPRFELAITQANVPTVFGISPDSPAGKYITDHQDDFARLALTFQDPHQGKGGFGASTAQFLLTYAFINRFSLPLAGEGWGEGLLRTYLSYAWNGVGLKPSGADLMAQATGKITLFAREPWRLEAYDWPFKEMGFLLIKTRHKLATHQHLAALPAFKSEKLYACMQTALQHFFASDEQGFANSVNHYAELLAQADLVSQDTLLLMAELKKIPGVLAAKGCGALGADTILILSKLTAKPAVLTWAQEQGLQCIANETAIQTVE